MNSIKSTVKFDYMIKLILLGKDSIGKTQFFERIKLFEDYKSFKKKSNNYLTTVGIDFCIFKIKFNNKVFNLQIWDTAGLERYSSLTKSFYIKANSILLFYDPLDKESFKKAKNLYEGALKVNDKAIYFLIRSKYDLSSNSKKNELISDEEALEFADKNNLFFFHISSFEKNENGFNEILEILLREYLRKVNN